MKLSPKTKPKAARNMSARTSGKYGWDLGTVCFSKRTREDDKQKEK